MKPSDLVGAGVLMAYYLVVIVALPTLIKAKTRVPLEVVRKIQHIAYSPVSYTHLDVYKRQAEGRAGWRAA